MSEYVPLIGGASQIGKKPPPPKKKAPPPPLAPKKAAAPVSAPPLQEPRPHYQAGADVSQAPPQPHLAVRGPVPPGPPDPKLAVHGVFQPIDAFSRRVDLTVNAFRTRYGYDPTPGLIFDVARSTVPDNQIGGLFNSQSPGNAFYNKFKPEIADNRILNNGKGKATFLTPMTLMAAQIVSEHPQTFKEATETHPYYDPATLPIKVAGFGMIKSNLKMRDAYRMIGDGTLVVTDHGLDLNQRLKELKPMLNPETGALDAATAKMMALRNNGAEAIKVMKASQERMNELMGTDLPVTGFYNQDWMKAVVRYSHTANAVNEQSKLLVEAAGVPDVSTYIQAMKNKQRAVNKSAATQWLYNGLPLYLFQDGASPLAIAGSALNHIAGGAKHGDLLQAFTRSGAIAFDGMGAGYQQLESWGHALHVIAQDTISYQMGHNVTHDQAQAHLRAALNANPSLVNALLNVNINQDSPGWQKALNLAGEVVGAIVISHRPPAMGGYLEAGNVPKALQNGRIAWGSKHAYQYLRLAAENRAVAMLGGGQGAEQLTTFFGPLVRSGQMSMQEFQHYAAVLYAHGRVELPVGMRKLKMSDAGIPNADLRNVRNEVEGSIFPDLRSRQLKSPGRITRPVKTGQASVRDFLDKADGELRAGYRFLPGVTTNTAAALIHMTRTAIQHAAPTGDFRHFYEPNLPERVHNFVLKYQLGDDASAQLANELETSLIRNRARENMPGIVAIQDKMNALFRAKYPGRVLPPEDPFAVTKVTDLPSRFQFPGMTTDQQKLLKGYKRMGLAADDINARLNRAAAFHRRWILSGAPIPGGEVLFFKHAVADTMRRALGGGFLQGKQGRAYTPELDALLESSPRVRRAFGTFMARVREGETRYMGGTKTFRQQFRTTDAESQGKEFHAATGAYLRNYLNDPIFEAFTKSTPTDVSPMVHVILHNKDYQMLFKQAFKAREAERDALLPPGLRSYVGTAPAARFGVSIPPTLTREEFALMLHHEFHDIGQALDAAGKDWTELRTFYSTKSLGKAHNDAKLGKWAYDHGLDLNVKGGEIEQTALLDDLMLRWIGKLMIPNKWNRGKFGENVMRRQYGELRAAGWDPHDAAETAMHIAEKQSVYHMLDFANMLQVEQDARWVAYFATKHRLYMKWLISTMAHNPAAVTAATQIRDSLDEKLAFQLGFKIAGMNVAIPLARLIFVNSKDYTNYSPPIQAGVGVLGQGKSITDSLGGGAYGNFIGRSDQAIIMARNAAMIQIGRWPANEHSMLAGLSSATKNEMLQYANEYRIDYEDHHGGKPPDPADAIRWAMWRGAATEAHRANLPLPVILESPRSSLDSATQKDLKAFQSIIDPNKARQFLEDHPAVAKTFGLHASIEDRIYLDGFFNQFNAAEKQHRARRAALYAPYQHGKPLDAAFFKQRDAIDKTFSDIIDQLKLQDAEQSGGKIGVNAAGKRTAASPGKWGALFGADPLLDPVTGNTIIYMHDKMGLQDLPLKLLASHSVNDTIEQAGKALDFFNDPAIRADPNSPFSTPQGMLAVKTTKRLLLDFTADFRGVPKDQLGKDSRWYIDNVVTPFWKTAEARYQHIQHLPTGERNIPYAELRAWKDKMDKPTVHNGVSWPSPVRLAWMRLSSQEQKGRLAQLAASDPQHLSAYELQFLTGDKTITPKATEGWVQLEKIRQAFRDQYGSITKDQEAWAVKLIAKGSGGAHVPGLNAALPSNERFAKLYQWSLKPRAERIFSMQIVKESPYYNTEVGWKSLLTAANNYIADSRKKNYSDSEIKKNWTRYLIGRTTQPGPYLKWIQSNPAFYKEIQLYGPDLINTLVNPK